MEPTTAGPDRRFEIPGTARIVEGNGGLAKVLISLDGVAGEMYLHGAHVTAWKPRDGEEVLFVSSQSHWQDGRAIRGGVPICFPWFGNRAENPQAPAHGFVRTKAWQIESISRAGNAVTVSMFTESDESTRKWWPADFRLVHRATFGPELSLELVATNTGKTPLRLEEALHTYHHVGNIEQTRVGGLDTVHYLDKTDSNQDKVQQGEIAIVSETDRVYLNTAHPIELEDPVLRRRTRVTKENSRTTVVWNPGAEKAHFLSDFGDDEWRQMICIETSNVANFAVELAPGQQHKMAAHVKVSGL